MKKTRILPLASILMVMAFLIYSKAIAQVTVPQEVASIVKMKLDEGQAKLKSLGYEICSSSLFRKKQDWFNEKDKICVTVKFEKKGIK